MIESIFSYKKFLAILIFIIFLVVTISFIFKTPKLVLWSWKRQENLSFVDKNFDIAPLIGVIIASEQYIKLLPRENPIKYSKNSNIIPVIRLEIDRKNQINEEKLLEELVANILALATPLNAQTIQIDFDATSSQRGFYKKLLFALKEKLPINTKLSITALASWCLNDSWLDDMPIEYAVPMFYRMGEKSEEIKKIILKKKKWSSSKCEGYVGFNKKDIFLKLPKDSTIFIFNDKAWTKEDYHKLRKIYE